MKKAEKIIDGDSDIATFTSYIGQGSPRFWLGLNPQLPNEAYAEIVIVSKDLAARERIKQKIESAVAEGALTEARVRVDRFNFGPPVGFPVQFRVMGQDPQQVRDIAYRVRNIMHGDPAARDPQLDWNEMMPSVRLVLDQDRVRALGLTPRDVANSLQLLISGVTVTTVRDGIDKVDVVARATPEERADLGRLGDLTIVSRNGVPVPVVASGEEWFMATRTRSCGGATATPPSQCAPTSSMASSRRTCRAASGRGWPTFARLCRPATVWRWAAPSRKPPRAIIRCSHSSR